MCSALHAITHTTPTYNTSPAPPAHVHSPRKVRSCQQKHKFIRFRQTIHLNEKFSLHPSTALMLPGRSKQISTRISTEHRGFANLTRAGWTLLAGIPNHHFLRGHPFGRGSLSSSDGYLRVHYSRRESSKQPHSTRFTTNIQWTLMKL